MASYWKLAKGKFAYITSRGKRGITSTLAKAKQLSGSSTSRSNPKRGKTRKVATTSKGRSTARRSRGIIGSMGFKGLLINTAVVTGLKYAIRRFVPSIQPIEDSVSLIGAGAVGHFTGTGKSLMQAGVIDLGSDLLSSFLTGNLGSTVESVGGYDF